MAKRGEEFTCSRCGRVSVNLGVWQTTLCPTCREVSGRAHMLRRMLRMDKVEGQRKPTYDQMYQVRGPHWGEDTRIRGVELVNSIVNGCLEAGDIVVRPDGTQVRWDGYRLLEVQ